jgi:predicted transposase YbfD/YdcC
MARKASPALLDHFADLADPRMERTKRHQLTDIIFIAVCAIVCGANDFVGMEEFGKSKQAWLKKYLRLPNDIPSHDTFGRVFAALDAQGFLDCFRSWVESLALTTKGMLVGFDGKTARASGDAAQDQNPVHVVSAWAAANRLLLGQVAVEEKSNEITAIPRLLEILELHGAIVTIDAMGCQKEIAAKIRERGADYVLAVKGNQEHLEEDIIEQFGKLDAGEISRRGLSSYATKEETGHGRTEQRFCDALPVPATLRHLEDWKDLHSICRVTRIYTEKGEAKSEVRYFISSLKASAKLLAEAIRGHWGIENGLHWVLDMYFGEDRNRARTDHAAENLALLRRWVLSMLARDTSTKASIEKKRLTAGWNEDNLEKLLGLC